jgi:hypothetical protein
MSPTLQTLLIAFVGLVIVVTPFVFIFDVLYPLKRRLEPEEQPSRVKLPFNAHPIAVFAVALVVVAAIGIVLYTLITNQ